MDYTDKYGFINLHDDSKTEENGVLFTVQYLLLKDLLGELEPQDIPNLNKSLCFLKQDHWTSIFECEGFDVFQWFFGF